MNERLYRSRDDRMLAGVAGGLAEYWDADPSLIRIVWAVLTVFTGGIALLVYIVMAIVVPEDPLGYGPPPSGAAWTPPPTAGAPDAASELRAQRASQRADERQARRDARDARRAERRARRGDGRTGTILIGGFLVVLGVWFLAKEYLPLFDTDWLWPAVLIGLGVLVLALAFRPRDEDSASGSDWPTSTSTSAAPAAPTAPVAPAAQAAPGQDDSGDAAGGGS
jgi:phage shock protein C